MGGQLPRVAVTVTDVVDRNPALMSTNSRANLMLLAFRELRSEYLLMESDRLHPASCTVCCRCPVDTNLYTFKPLTDDGPVGAQSL